MQSLSKKEHSLLFIVVLLVLLYYLFENAHFHRAIKSIYLQQPNNITIPLEILNKSFQVNKESVLAHQLLDGLKGIEIGASHHNPFGLDTINVDYSDNISDLFQQHQIETTGQRAKVHVLAMGDQLPFANDSFDFVVNSHVLEHFYDPIKAIQEWLRVVKPGGYVYMDIPHKERTFDRPRNRTTLAEILERHSRNPTPEQMAAHHHHSVWITEDLMELCRYFKWTVAEWRDMDDKLGIGFTIVLRKP